MYDINKEDWVHRKWRPMMGWLYMIICAVDFVIFPILFAIYNAAIYGSQLPQGIPSQWQPLSLQGAGLLHISMGAILGVTAWGRTQEKINALNIPTQLDQEKNQVIVGYKGKPAPMPQSQPIL